MRDIRPAQTRVIVLKLNDVSFSLLSLLCSIWC